MNFIFFRILKLLNSLIWWFQYSKEYWNYSLIRITPPPFFHSKCQMLEAKCIWVFITITLAGAFQINLTLFEFCLQLSSVRRITFCILFLEFPFSRFLLIPTPAISHVNLYFFILWPFFFHYTIPNHELWQSSQQKGFKLLNLPLKPPICPAHYRFIVLSKISCCPPLLFFTCFLIWPQVQGPLFQSFLQVPSIHRALPPYITAFNKTRPPQSQSRPLLHNTQVVSIATAIQP